MCAGGVGLSELNSRAQLFVWRARANLLFTIREFPSLSGAPQPTQSQNPSQMVWANASQRAAQTPVQRQQAPPTTQPPSRTSQTPSNLPQQQSQPSHDDLFPSGVQFANRLDDFRNGGQGISGQLGGGQPQTGSIDEFPPLGRNAAAEIGQDRRGSMMQNAGFGGYNASIGFQGQSAQTRNIMAASVNGQETGRMMSPANMSPAGMPPWPPPSPPPQAWRGLMCIRYCGVTVSSQPGTQRCTGPRQRGSFLSVQYSILVY